MSGSSLHWEGGGLQVEKVSLKKQHINWCANLIRHILAHVLKFSVLILICVRFLGVLK